MHQRLAGNTGRPVHTNAFALQELKRETAQRCPELSPICEKLLATSMCRADMKEIAEQIRDDLISPALEDISSDACLVLQGTTPTYATTSNASTASSEGLLAPGMRVKYLARSDSIWYAGVLVGRLAGSSGWLVSLDCGQTKEVDNHNLSRLAREA